MYVYIYIYNKHVYWHSEWMMFFMNVMRESRISPWILPYLSGRPLRHLQTQAQGSWKWFQAGQPGMPREGYSLVTNSLRHRNHRKTMAKWWFNGIHFGIPEMVSVYKKRTGKIHHAIHGKTQVIAVISTGPWLQCRKLWRSLPFRVITCHVKGRFS